MNNTKYNEFLKELEAIEDALQIQRKNMIEEVTKKYFDIEDATQKEKEDDFFRRTGRKLKRYDLIDEKSQFFKEIQILFENGYYKQAKKLCTLFMKIKKIQKDLENFFEEVVKKDLEDSKNIFPYQYFIMKLEYIEDKIQDIEYLVEYRILKDLWKKQILWYVFYETLTKEIEKFFKFKADKTKETMERNKHKQFI